MRKSTALKTLCRLIGLKGGSINLEDGIINLFSSRELARRIAMLTQSPSAPDELTVRQLVSMGRFAYQNYLGSVSNIDRKAVCLALEACGLGKLSERPLGSLSGGQLQRAWLAMILAQNSSIILLDEPTNHLDITHQIEALELIRQLNDADQTIIVVMHDLNLAARYADRIVMFKEGKVMVDGPPENIRQEKIIKDIFSVKCRIITDPVYGKPLFIYTI